MGKLRVLIILLAGCQNSTLECSALQTCGAGAYKFCKQGAGACYYSLSDGNIVNCADCSNCRAALQTVTDWCAPPPPDMSEVSTSFGLVIPKSGPPYTGPHNDPGLNDISQCADFGLEPNDGPDPNGHPLAFTPVPDQPTAKIIKLAICPKGPSPLVAQHDQDWFKIDTNVGPALLSLKAEVFYDINLGDLDVAITDGGGNILSADGTSVSNGCSTAIIGHAVYYVVITGANGVDVNNYELLIRTFSSPQTCP